jgi:D-alanine-D-alanine ligase
MPNSQEDVIMPTATATKPRESKEPKSRQTKARQHEKIELAIDKKALKKLKLVAVAYSYVEREMFPTEDAYKAEVEVEERAQEVIKEVEKLGISAKGYAANQYLIANLQIDDPDFVVNLVDTLKGQDLLQTSVPAALELANIPYTGAGMQGLIIGNDRHLTKQMLMAFDIPTPKFQFIRRAGTDIDEELGLPLIVKLNEGGGSVGINNDAVKETFKDAQKRVDELIKTYKIPVIVEQFIDGREINAIVFDDGQRRHVFLGKKDFHFKPDGKHAFTSLESYDDVNSWGYKKVADEELTSQITRLAQRAFGALSHRDYSKFDIRVDEKTGTPYFTDSNPNTAFGPQEGTPIRDILKELYHIKFDDVLASLLSKYARKIERS